MEIYLRDTNFRPIHDDVLSIMVWTSVAICGIIITLWIVDEFRRRNK